MKSLIAFVIVTVAWGFGFMLIQTDQDRQLRFLDRRLNCLEDGGVTSTIVNIQIDKTTVVFNCMKNEKVLYSWDK